MASGKKNTAGNIIFIIFIIAIIIIVILFTVLGKLSSKIPDNPKGTVGNTAGNIYNSGLFCEDDGVVYFANVYDQNSLYSMNPDGTNINKILSAKVKYINAAGKNLYYYMSDSSTSTGLGFIRRVMGIYRCKKDGKNVQTVSRYPSLEMILIDNDIYYQHYDNKTAVSLHKTDLEGKKDIQLANQIINPAGVYDDVIYFANQTNNHFLMVLDTTDDSISEYVRYNVWNPIRQGNFIYFLDIDNNYRLARYNLTDDEVEILTKERIDCYNLNTDYIIYQVNDAENPCLMRMAVNGDNKEKVMDGNFVSINFTSTYVYFCPFENQEMFYKTPAYGSIHVTEFTEAKPFPER